MNIITFYRKSGETPKFVVDFLQENDTFLQKNMDVDFVETIAITTTTNPENRRALQVKPKTLDIFKYLFAVSVCFIHSCFFSCFHLFFFSHVFPVLCSFLVFQFLKVFRVFPFSSFLGFFPFFRMLETETKKTPIVKKKSIFLCGNRTGLGMGTFEGDLASMFFISF